MSARQKVAPASPPSVLSLMDFVTEAKYALRMIAGTLPNIEGKLPADQRIIDQLTSVAKDTMKCWEEAK